VKRGHAQAFTTTRSLSGNVCRTLILPRPVTSIIQATHFEMIRSEK